MRVHAIRSPSYSRRFRSRHAKKSSLPISKPIGLCSEPSRAMNSYRGVRGALLSNGETGVPPNRQRRPETASGNDPLQYFRLTKGWGAGQRLVASEVVELNSCRKQFTDKTTAALYRKWVAGTATDREVISSFATSVTPSVGVFRAEKWGDSLSVFICGNPESSENWSEKSCEAVSPQFSPEIRPL